MADGQKDYLQGVIESYQTRTSTKMTVASERLAVIAAATLPLTALPSVPGMNVIVNTSTYWLAHRTPGGHARDVGHPVPLGQAQG
jgi:Mg2+ and Co2+ transporter CorA